MSSNEWQKTTLGSVVNILSGGTPSTRVPEYWADEIKWVTAKDVSESSGYKIYDTDRKISKLGLENSPANIIPKEATVLIARGATMGRCCMLGEDMAINQTCFALTAKEGKTHPYFLFYAIKNLNDFFQKIAHGAIFNTVIGSGLRETEISLPPLPAQRRIADILSALDEKIELNSQTNATLEAIAQSIFKEWFMENKEVENWKTGKVGDVVRRIPVGKKYDFKTALPEGKVPILDQSHFTIIGYHNEKPGIDANVDNPVLVFSNHRCYTDIIHFPFSAIQNVLPFIGDGVDTRWLYHATDGIITYSEYKGHYPEFISKPLVIPPKDLTKEFGELVKPLHIKIMRNKEESHTLASLRDTLLPKLMSGEIEV